MNANQVRALVEQQFPGLLSTPLALAMQAASALAMLESSNANEVLAKADLLFDARAHANACIWACDGWTVETLSHNIESCFGGELDIEDCDAIAKEALGL